MFPDNPSFMPAQPCGVGILQPPVKVKVITIKKGGLNTTRGLPVVGTLDLHRDIVFRKTDEARREQLVPEGAPKSETLSPGPAATKLPEIQASPAGPFPIERAVAQGGPKPENCEERCRELEEENRALTRVIARLQTENDRLRASRA